MNDIIKAALVLPAILTASVFVSGLPKYSDGSEALLLLGGNIAFAIVGVTILLAVKTVLWLTNQLRR